MTCEEYRTAVVAADVDGALDEQEQRAADAHVTSCAGCAAARERQADARALLRRLPTPPVSIELRQRIDAALDAVDAPPSSRSSGKVVPLVRRRTFLLVGAFAAALAVMLLPYGRWNQPDLLGLLVQEAHALESGTIELAMRADRTEDMRAFFAGEDLGFDRTVPGLERRGFRPVGAFVDRSGAAGAAVTVFRNADGEILCRRYPIDAMPMPTEGERFGDAVVITRDGVTMRFVRDGDALCCLASTMPRAEFMRALGLAEG